MSAGKLRSVASRGAAGAAMALITMVVAFAYDTSSANPTSSKTFMVSALLRRQDSDAVVKLVHSRVAAHDAAEARDAVLREVNATYIGYVVIDTLTSELDEKPVPCTGRPQLWTQTADRIGPST